MSPSSRSREYAPNSGLLAEDETNCVLQVAQDQEDVQHVTRYI